MRQGNNTFEAREQHFCKDEAREQHFCKETNSCFLYMGLRNFLFLRTVVETYDEAEGKNICEACVCVCGCACVCVCVCVYCIHTCE